MIAQLVSTEEAMTILGVGKTKFFQLLKDGELVPTVRLGRENRFRKADVLKLLTKRKPKA